MNYRSYFTNAITDWLKRDAVPDVVMLREVNMYNPAGAVNVFVPAAKNVSVGLNPSNGLPSI